MDIQLVLTYTLTTNNINKIYYIKVNENDSKIKAKNLLAKTVFPALMKAMDITDSNLIESNKKDMIKAIKRKIYEESLNTLNNRNYTCIEIIGNISNIDRTTIIKRRKQDGVMEDIEGEKYISKIYPNMSLYIVKHDYIKGWYYIIDKNTGISLTNVKTKNKKNIETELNNINMTENEVIEKLNNMTNTTQTTKDNNIIDTTMLTNDKELHKDNIIETSNKTIILKGYTLLKESNNIKILGKIKSYTSIFNETYDIVTNLQIIKDDSVFYKANNINFPVDCEGKVSIVDYLDDIILYITHTSVDPYWITIQLDKLLITKTTITFEIMIKNLKSNIVEQTRIKEYEQNRKELNELKEDIINLANSKNILACIGYAEIRLLKNIPVNQHSHDFIKYVLEMDINDNLLKPYLLKQLNKENNPYEK